MHPLSSLITTWRSPQNLQRPTAPRTFKDLLSARHCASSGYNGAHSLLPVFPQPGPFISSGDIFGCYFVSTFLNWTLAPLGSGTQSLVVAAGHHSSRCLVSPQRSLPCPVDPSFLGKPLFRGSALPPRLSSFLEIIVSRGPRGSACPPSRLILPNKIYTHPPHQEDDHSSCSSSPGCIPCLRKIAH